MTKMSTHEAKAYLSGLRAAVERRDEVFIARRGRTVHCLSAR